jgi:hypothetical protein
MKPDEFEQDFAITQQPTERRADNQVLLLMVRSMHTDVNSLRADLKQHMTSETSELAEAVAELLKRSFPDGDPDGHRKHHEASIAAAEAKAAFWEKMRFEITRWGLAGFLGWALFALWTAFLKGPVK